jgi:heavy metal sensor kinase
MSLRAKLVLWNTAFLALTGGLLTTGLYLLTEDAIHDEAQKFLEEDYEDLARLTLQDLQTPKRVEDSIRAEIAHSRAFPMVYRLRDSEARRDLIALAAAGLEEALAAPLPAESPTRRKHSLLRLPAAGITLRVLTGPLDRRRRPNLILQVGMHNLRLDRRVATLRKHLVAVLAVLVLAAAIGGWVLASRSLKPIDRIVTELGHVESATLAARLEVGASGGEVDRLREAINRMLARLNTAFDRLQSFTADAAHELRTPIAALQCHLELAVNRPASEAGAREALAEALDQVAELHALVDNMLLLARMDAEPKLRDAGPVDVGALLRDIAEPFQLLAEQKGVSLAVECDGEVRTQGDGALLRRLFGNLLDNAVRYTPAGGRVTAHARRDGGCVVAVADTGIGIRPEALPHIFDRFYRADESRSRDAGGAGLGLSIARRVVELHRGRITLDSTPGEGTTVEVWLPDSQVTRHA